MRRTIVCLGVMVLVVAAASASAEEQPLAGEQMMKLLSGNTAVGEDGEWKQYFDPDGETPYETADGEVDFGRWKVEGDTYLSWWESTGWTSYTMTGEGASVTWISDDGDSRFPATIVEGNQLD